MESFNLITYKWEQGVYSLEDLVVLVKYNVITPEQFFDITRFDYAAAAQKFPNLVQKSPNPKTKSE